ncbi:hypothetical protein CBR_g37305 [Chara braunii]|uniref:DEUBAD domain-containing protein n=1 Tax=Chara braunii TaxID=69332 RepID=A0A388LML8_CHABU|nr:hypothetical protein CBR_g37305 [Chara braunii]|eukprot:GBG83586.1 hypothetical protein CBR_g37305 [Chara braunii]
MTANLKHLCGFLLGVVIRDEYPYNKRDVLSSCYSPLAYLELRDIVNMETCMKMLTTQEQQELMKLLPRDDVKGKGSLADMFNSCQFEAALVNFQHLLLEGMFDSSEMGPSARVFQHYQKLLSVVDLTSSGWMEGVTQLCKKSRRRGQPSDAGKDEIDDARLASEMAAFAERRASSQKASEGSSRKLHLRSCAEMSPAEEDAANDRCLRGAESAVSSSNSREPSRWTKRTSGGPSQREGAVGDGYVVAEPVIMGHQAAEPIEDQNAASAHLAPTIRSAPVVAMQSVAMGPQFWNTQWQRADPVVGAQCIVSNVATGNCEPVSGKSSKRSLDGGTESTPVSFVTYPAGSGEGMPFVNGMYGARGWFKPPTVCDRLTTGLQAVPPARGDGISGGIWAAGSPIVDPDRYVAIPVPSVSIASPVAVPVPVPVPDFIRVVETVDDGSAAARSHSTKAERHPSYNRASCREDCAVSCSTVASPLVSPIPAYTINGSSSPLDALLYNGVVRVVGSAERAEGSGIGGESIRRPVTAGGALKSYCSAAAATSAPCNGADHGLMYTVQVDPRKISYAQALPVMHTRDMLLVPNAAAYPAMLMTGEGWQMYTDPMWENVLWANQGCAGQDRRLLNGPVLYQSQIP